MKIVVFDWRRRFVVVPTLFQIVRRLGIRPLCKPLIPRNCEEVKTTVTDAEVTGFTDEMHTQVIFVTCLKLNMGDGIYY